MKRKILLFVLLFFLLFSSFVFSLILGGEKISPRSLINVLLNPDSENPISTILWKIRLPRSLLALMVGAGLATCGCVFQGILRNPLAEPYTLGISGGAALGAVLGEIFFSQFLGCYSLPLTSFLGALFSVFLVYFFASQKKFSPTGLILSGVILSFLFSSCVLLIFALIQPERFHTIVLWLMGDLSAAPTEIIRIVSFCIISGFVLLLFFSRKLDILTLGEEKATSLGVEPESGKKIFFLLASLIVSACVSSTGMIAFVGLIIPHFFRWIVGTEHPTLLPAAFLGGAIFLLLADTCARTIIYPVEIPVGVITGIVGGTFFLIFFLKSKKWQIF